MNLHALMNIRADTMKRFRLGTLLLLIAVAALCLVLPELARGMSRPNVEPEFRYAEFQRVLMVVVFVSLCLVARRARGGPCRGGRAPG